MRIPCPFCGPRDLVEFTVLGEARDRPRLAAEVLDSQEALEAFNAYVYERDNPAGPHKEHWFHGSGCQSWLTVVRDTRTHEILSVRLAAEDVA